MKTVYFKFPTPREVASATRFYNETVRRLTEDGILSKNRLMLLLNKNEIYTFDMANEIDKIESLSKIKYKKPYEGLDEQDAYRAIEEDIIEVITGERFIDLKYFLTRKTENAIKDNDIKRYYELCALRDSSLKYSLESLAEQQRTMFLAQICSYNGDNNRRVWENWEMFCNEKNRVFQSTVVNLCSSFLSGIPQSRIRRIARHPIWRSKWISATKTGSQVFDGTVSSWDSNKTFLCYWSNFYDNIYSASEPPDDFVVEDDELLDGWLAKKARELKSGSGSSNGAEDGTVGIFRNRVNPVVKKR